MWDEFSRSLLSEYNAQDRAYQSSSYEFCDVILSVDDVDLVAPSPWQRPLQFWSSKVLNIAKPRLGYRRVPTFEPVHLKQHYDLFMFVSWTPGGLVELSRINHWRNRCTNAALYLSEIFAANVELEARYLKDLKHFDYIFTPHAQAIPKLKQFTSGEVLFLPPGSDCLRTSPFPTPPKRVIDVFSWGNRPHEIHQQFLKMCQSQEIFYQFDSLASSDSRVKDWAEHRLLLANNIKRSRFVITYDVSAGTLKSREAAGEQVLGTRFFEGAAGGSVMLGSAPKCSQFKECFDWQDAVIEVSPKEPNLRDVFHHLCRETERLARVRRTNAVQSLRRHDWVYRWNKILETVKLPPDLRAQLRVKKLNAVAEAAEHDVSGVTCD